MTNDLEDYGKGVGSVSFLKNKDTICNIFRALIVKKTVKLSRNLSRRRTK